MEIRRKLGVALIPHEPLYYTMAAGATFGGAMAGILLSPVAMVNIVSAAATGCDYASHMRSQSIYVVLCAGVSIFLGYMPLSGGLKTAFGMVMVAVFTYALYDTIGKKPDQVNR